MRRLFILAVVLIAAGVMLTACGPRVPDVSGVAADEAVEQLTSLGFEVAPLEYNGSKEGTPGIIVAQQPAAGERVDEGSLVSLTVQGPPPVDAPEVVGLTQDEAAQALEAANLLVGELSEAYSDTVATGIIISQDPGAGVETLEGFEVALVISMGPEPVPVPQVKGQTEAEARSTLEQAGFLVTVETQHNSAAKGTVLSQSPEGGEAVPGTTVTLTVSDGVEMVRVPEVNGLWANDADAKIRAAGLVPKDIPVHGGGNGDWGIAYGQTPAAGTWVPKGSTVTYYYGWEAG